MRNLQFINVNVFDGISAELLNNQIVVISEGIIKSVLPYSESNVQNNCETIDASGLTLMPGLIDAHAGIVGLNTAEQHYGVTHKAVASSVLRGVKGGENCIRAGVTTIRVDMTPHHGTYALREAFDAGVFLGPHMIMPGRAICTTCGHGWNLGNHVADGPWEVRKAVREEIMAGAEWIKLMITGGAVSPNERVNDKQMCKEEIFSAIDEAHARGKKVFAHLTVTQAIYEAVEAGIDSVEHGIYLDAACAKKLSETGTYLVPTLGVYRRLADCGKNGLVPDYMYQKSLPIVERHTGAFHHAINAGVKIVAGTDSGQDWYPLGTSLIRELEIMNEEGLSNVEVLISATSRSAIMLNKPEIGRVEAGKSADLLLVKGNPLRNMSDIRNTRYVLKDGVLVYAVK